MIPALEKLRQEDREFEVSLDYIVSPTTHTHTKQKQTNQKERLKTPLTVENDLASRRNAFGS